MKKVLLLAYGHTGVFALKSLIKKYNVVSIVVPPESKNLYRPKHLLDVERIALSEKIRIVKSNQLKQIGNLIEKFKTDAVIVSSFNKKIPNSLLIHSKFINVHHGDLPRWRGRANINWAIINNRKKIGLSIHEMTTEIDDGRIYAQYTIKIEEDDTVKTVYDKINTIIKENLANVVQNVLDGFAGELQTGLKTYCCTRVPEDGSIDWNSTTKQIHNLIRGLTKPYSGAYTYYDKKRIIVWESEIPKFPKIYEGRIPGRVVEIHKDYGIEVLTGDSTIILKTINYDGANVNSSALIKSVKITLGLSLDRYYNILMNEISSLSEKIKLLEEKA